MSFIIHAKGSLYKKAHRSAFTLIELLVVIAIIAILAIVIILTLNPAELLRQSRDTRRISDISTLDNAITEYIADQGQSNTFFLGSSTTTYLSLPDPTATSSAGTDCSGIGFPGGGYFHCDASSTLRNTNGTGWIPINFSAMSAGSPIGNIPIDPTNQSSTNLYYSYATNGNTFKLTSVPESQKYLAQGGINPGMFMTGSNLNIGAGYGWVLVPGNSKFGTNNFWVMKYSAVCTDGLGNYLNDYNTGYQSYDNIAKPCSSVNNRQIGSLPGGWPMANISQVTSTLYCQSVGGHLINNNEWQTIAWNAESQPSNWSSGAVGTGFMYSGHSDGNPSGSTPAGFNDNQGCYGTDGPTSCGGTGATTSTSQIRTLTLSNGSVLWDLAGNIYQWTSDTITGTNEPNAGPSGFVWNELTAITTWGSLSQQIVGPMNSTWNSMQGIGKIYSEGATDSQLYGFLRGGSFGAGANSGIEGFALGATPGWSAYYGFRCTR